MKPLQLHAQNFISNIVKWNQFRLHVHFSFFFVSNDTNQKYIQNIKQKNRIQNIERYSVWCKINRKCVITIQDWFNHTQKCFLWDFVSFYDLCVFLTEAAELRFSIDQLSWLTNRQSELSRLSHNVRGKKSQSRRTILQNCSNDRTFPDFLLKSHLDLSKGHTPINEK